MDENEVRELHPIVTGTLMFAGKRAMENGGQWFDEAEGMTGEWVRAYSNVWAVSLQCEGRTMVSEYSTGCGLAEVSLREAVNSLLMDAHTYGDHASVGEMAVDFGITDVDEANRIWEALRENERKLRNLLGPERYNEWYGFDEDVLVRDPLPSEPVYVENVIMKRNKRFGKWKAAQ